MSHVIGLDIGSQSVKAVLLDASGQTVDTAAAPLMMTHPHNGWAEQRPADWDAAVTRAVRQMTSRHPEAVVDVVGMASQVDGVVLTDADNRALGPAIIWLDHRAVDQSEAMTGSLGRDQIFEQTGLNADASHGAPKMMWLREHDSATWRRAECLASVGSYLLARMTGARVHDHANASSTLLYDLRTRAYHERLLAAAGIEERLLPRIAESADVAGTLTSEWSAELGLASQCRVVVGTGDEHAAALSAAAATSDVVVDITGTAEPVAAASSDPVLDPGHLVETHGHALAGWYLVENPGFVSGGSTLWLAQQLLRRPQGDVFELAARSAPGSDGVLFVPALSGATAPRWDERMRGAFAGLAMNHDDTHLSRAVLEGCAYALRDVVDALGALGLGQREVRVVGGGARSTLWMQIKADVLGKPVRAVEATEATALGAALLAATAADFFADVVEAASAGASLSPTTVDPEPANVARYAETYPRYRRLFDGVQEAEV